MSINKIEPLETNLLPELIEVKQEPLDATDVPVDCARKDRRRLKRLKRLKRYLKRTNTLEALKLRHLDLKQEIKCYPTILVSASEVKDEATKQEDNEESDQGIQQESYNTYESTSDDDSPLKKEEIKGAHKKTVGPKKSKAENSATLEKVKDVCECICEMCGQLFHSMKNMLRHMEGYHTIPGTALKRGNKTVFKCQFCELEFPARNQLFRHCNHKHADQLKQRLQETTGKSSHTKEKIDPESNLQPRVCIHCNVKTDNLEEFISHLEKNHSGTFCDICYKVFQDPSFLMLHRRVHFAGNPFACDLCPKVFKSLQHVGEHRRGHTGDKPYKCAQCPMGFARIGDLNKHNKLRHTDEPSYMCAICPETFHSSSLFHRHKQKHLKAAEMGADETRVETFPCDQCGKMFENGNDRKEHVLTSHAEGRPFGCQSCGKRFKLSGHLKAHMHTHTGLKTQKCDHCSAAFYLPGDLRRHLRTHRKPEEH